MYTDEIVHLYHHPFYSEAVVEIPWSEGFAGITLILFKEYPTAIVKVDSFADDSRLYSVLAHELFHRLQYVKGESRFPDEVLGITYPNDAENIALHQQEHLHLYKSVMATDIAERVNDLNQFISYRERRAEVIGQFMEYEQLIETVEDPAYYVELNAYIVRSGM